jgi:hypothetical protein
MVRFEIAEEIIRKKINKTTDRIKKLKVRCESLPARVPLADARKGQEAVKLSTERKHLTNVLKMVAYQIESDLVELIHPEYKRVEDEGRTFIQTVLQDTADIEPKVDQLRITLAPPQFATSITSSRNSLRRAQQDKHAVPGYSASHALFGHALSSGGKKRTPSRLTMSGVLNLEYPEQLFRFADIHDKSVSRGQRLS